MRALRVAVLVALTLTMAAPAQANHWRHRAFASPFSRPHDAGLLTVDVGSAPSVAALDSVTHTLYVPNENDGTISLIDTARCNIRRPAGCRNAAPTVPMGTNPVSITVDARTRTVYVVGLGDHAVSVLDATRCNAVTTTGCAPVATVPQPGDPIGSAIDPVTDTIYVGNSLTRALSVIDGRSCNRVTPTACSATTGTAATGAAPILPYVDVASRTLYVPNVVDGTVSVIDVRACNGQVATGCATTPPALTAGNAPLEAIVDPATHTLYVDNDDDGTMSVFDASTCNAAITTGCGQTAPTTRMGPIPSGGFILHPASHSLIVGVLESDVLVVLDTAVCHARATAGCESRWPTVRTGNVPYWLVHDPGTDTLYVSQYMDGEVSVLDAAACTALRRNGCRRTAPAIDVVNNNDIAISASQHTVYVADGVDHRLSMFDTDRCRADRLDRCAPVVVTVPRISGPARIAIDDATQTLYANNFDDRTTVVIDARRCNVSRQSGCVPVATAIATGPPPVGLAVDPVTHAVFVADVQDDTLMRFDGRQCNARDVSR
jgi:DNA-binding beta-propeller fold protein YncE